MDELFIIAGLGNPGNKYNGTKHNVGFEALDILSREYSIDISKLKHKALLGEGKIGGKRVVLVKPQTFMNLSGESLREIVSWYKADINKVIIIYDDIDLDLGKIRVRPKGSSGSHNGMKSLIYHLQNDNFPRVRIGIGKPKPGWDLANYVLSRFDKDEQEIIGEATQKSANAAVEIIKNGVESAMNKFNN